MTNSTVSDGRWWYAALALYCEPAFTLQFGFQYYLYGRCICLSVVHVHILCICQGHALHFTCLSIVFVQQVCMIRCVWSSVCTGPLIRCIYVRDLLFIWLLYSMCVCLTHVYLLLTSYDAYSDSYLLRDLLIMVIPAQLVTIIIVTTAQAKYANFCYQLLMHFNIKQKFCGIKMSKA